MVDTFHDRQTELAVERLAVPIGKVMALGKRIGVDQCIEVNQAARYHVAEPDRAAKPLRVTFTKLCEHFAENLEDE